MANESIIIKENTPENKLTENRIKQFQEEGYAIFHDVIDKSSVAKLNTQLQCVLNGKFDRENKPDKLPNTNTCQIKKRVWQIINIHKSNQLFHELVTHSYLGKIVTHCMGWNTLGFGYGARLAQDQVWMKPPLSSGLAFHRDSPYFMFHPNAVATVWIALDDMLEELGPIQYVKGSHLWTQQEESTSNHKVNGANKQFFGDGLDLLHSVANHQGLTKDDLEIVIMKGLDRGSLTIHDGKTWHGSGKNLSGTLFRRGIGLHFVPANVHFTKEATKSKLWRKYIDENDVENTILLDEHFPITYQSFK